MDIIKLTNPVSATKMEQGKLIKGIKSKLWIERYRDAGEFTFVSDIGSGIGRELSIGSFVSHTDTTEVMIVENIEINDDKGSESKITITGRSFETILENRIVGSNSNFPVVGLVTDFALSSAIIAVQAVNLINMHIGAGALLNDDDALPYVLAATQITTSSFAPTLRHIKYGPVYESLIELLEIENLGIKIIRPGVWSPYGAANQNLYIMIHAGTFNSSLVFSYARGAVESADYLWSNKTLKNAALVTSKWVQTVVLPTAKEYARRMMYVNASSVDQDLTSAPTGTALTNLIAQLQLIGRDSLNSQLDVSFSKPQLSKGAVRPIYRTDYNLGDVVYVAGDYRDIELMRVVEYVESEDETGHDEYPTFGQYEG